MAMHDAKQPCSPGDRRDFFKKVFATVIGTIMGLVPVGAGISLLLDPLRRKASGATTVRVTTLEALPADGIPRKFQVWATRVDAWNKFLDPIGAVYLSRSADGKIQALNVVCPHLGCFVNFLPERGHFLCPCHNSTFTVEGKIQDRRSPAARGLDALDVELRNEKEVWVKFQNFQASLAEKVPVT